MWESSLASSFFACVHECLFYRRKKKRTCQRPKHSLEEICNFLKNQTTQCNIQFLLSGFLIYFDFFLFWDFTQRPSFPKQRFSPWSEQQTEACICPVVSGINTLEHTQLRHSFIVLVLTFRHVFLVHFSYSSSFHPPHPCPVFHC